MSAPSPRGDRSPPAAIATAAPAVTASPGGAAPGTAPGTAPPPPSTSTQADWQRALDAVVPCVVVLK